jgi:hypothetical protein
VRQSGTLLIACALAALVLPGAAVSSTVLLFRTPSGNIGCVYSAGLGPGTVAPTVRCDIRSRLRPEPARPKSCRLDYGDSIEVSRHGRASLVCHGDTAIDPQSRVIAYGRTFRRGGITCTSETRGLTCSNSSGHGFFLSRQRWRIF